MRLITFNFSLEGLACCVNDVIRFNFCKCVNCHSLYTRKSSTPTYFDFFLCQTKERRSSSIHEIGMTIFMLQSVDIICNRRQISLNKSKKLRREVVVEKKSFEFSTVRAKILPHSLLMTVGHYLCGSSPRRALRES